MPLDLPSFETIVKRIRADVQGYLPELDPTIFGSIIRAITDSNAGRHYDNTLSIAQLEKELFPGSETSRESLERWATYEGLTPFVATVSTGNAVFTGTVGSSITATTQFTSDDGNSYTVDTTTAIVANSASITNLEYSGLTATATTASAHGLASNIDVTISGATETNYNGVYTITVLTSTTFSYELSIAPSASPATGTPSFTVDMASVPLTSEGFGTEQNLDSGAKLTVVATISGVDSIGYADVLGFTGGRDVETNENLLNRVLQSRSQPVANFNIAAITKKALEISGVTRVKVNPITPAVGEVTVLFVRDDDDDIIPSAGEITEVKDNILTILPATSDSADVHVNDPLTEVSTNYTFSSISPDTTTMRTAIENNLSAFYEDEVDFETPITSDKYRRAIAGTIDPDTGDSLVSFGLSTPTTTITITSNEIGTLGTVTF